MHCSYLYIYIPHLHTHRYTNPVYSSFRDRLDHWFVPSIIRFICILVGWLGIAGKYAYSKHINPHLSGQVVDRDMLSLIVAEHGHLLGKSEQDVVRDRYNNMFNDNDNNNNNKDPKIIPMQSLNTSRQHNNNNNNSNNWSNVMNPYQAQQSGHNNALTYAMQ